ncbi:MAG: ferritin-like domain-containing protein [Magnetospiraceae bacterium]
MNPGGELDQLNLIHTIEELLAHSLTLETEAAEHYDEIAHNMAVHNNQDVAEVFTKLASYARLHAAEMETLAEGKALPVIKPWDFKWPQDASPESVDDMGLHYLMTPHQALTVARKVEYAAMQFYGSVAETSPDPEVRKLALEFSEEEKGHVALLDEWIVHYPPPEDGWDEDPDPAHMPE